MRRWTKWAVAAGLAVAVAVPSFVLTQTADAATPAPATMPVDPAACAVTEQTGFDSAPADEVRAGSCREFTVATYGAYLARASDADNQTLASAVYSSGGYLACAVAWCNLGAGTYYLVADPGAAKPHTEPFRATVVDLLAGNCEPVTAQGYSDPYTGTFAHQGEVHCLAMPQASGRYQVTLPAGEVSTPMVQLVQDRDARMCTIAVTEVYGCSVTIDRPTRLIVVMRNPATSGEYRIAVQHTSGPNTCADLSPGIPGAPAGATVALSATDFVTCFDVAAGSGSPEILTLDRVQGDGTAWLSVYAGNGSMICQEPAAAAYQQIGCSLGSEPHMVVVRSATGSGRYRISQVGSISATCQAPASTAFGGPATADSIRVSGDVRCYQVPANSWIGAAGDIPTVRWFDAQGGLHACSALPCLVNSTEVIATSAKPADYQLDTWAVGFDYSAPADCTVITDTSAYGFGPVTATLSAADRAYCVSVPVGLRDKFRVTTNAEPYVINGDGSIVECPQSDTSWLCSPTPGPSGTRALMAFLAEETTAFRAEAECLTLFCGNASFGLGTGGSRYALTAGSTATFSIYGSALHDGDTVRLTQYGQTVAPIAVRAVSPNRDFYTADIDLTGVAAGQYDITATSYGQPNRTITGLYQVRVQAPQLAVTTKPSIAGKVTVGATVTVNPGAWSPAVDYYSYQWSANGVAIPGATKSSYTIPASLPGKSLTVTVTGHRLDHHDNTATSATVTVAYGVAPKATTAPKITGTIKVGKTVKVSRSAWSPAPTSYRYEWRINGKLVATTSSLKLKKAWSGKKLTVTVVAKRTGHADGKSASKAVKIKK